MYLPDILETYRRIWCCEEASNYFIQFKDVGKTVCDYGYDATIWKVVVPEGAVIDRKDDGFKSSSITLSDSQVIYSNYSLTKQIVKQNGMALEYARLQTDELRKLAVQQCGTALMLIDDQYEELCRLAIAQDGNAIHYVNNPTHELRMMAVKLKAAALDFIDGEDQTEEMCLIAVKQDGLVIEHSAYETPPVAKQQ